VEPVRAAVTVGPEELALARTWSAAHFEGIQATGHTEPALVVLANNDPVQKNGRAGRPLRLADRSYTRGLYCHAFSKITVRLPGPGAKFAAIVGVDSNEQTSGGRGSVEFSVQLGAVEKFRSGVLREGMPGKSVEVALEGARELTLQISETPDGIPCDQADWADAKVTLSDGRELWLSDLPLRTGERPTESTELPFSFVYDGKPSLELLKTWELKRNTRKIDAARTEKTLVWTDPKTKLTVRCVGMEYADYPTVEWTVHFRNEGASESPLLTEVLAIDTRFERGNDFTLHHNKGTFVRADDFEPLTTVMAADQKLRFCPPSGRPLGHVFPYFNLESQGEGIIVVVGWPGQWAAEFTREGSTGMRITAGQERVQCRLQPGEEIRTPLMVLQFWQGDWMRSQNIWRRWMLAHNVPRRGGEPLGPQLAACSSHQYAEMINADEASQKMFIDRYLEEKLPLDYWWMDAGWYYHYGKGWPQTGTWEVDTNRFPHQLRAITDYGRAKNVKSIVWFEPERVTPGTFLYTNNPAWLLGKDGDQKLLDLGHDGARSWLIAHIIKMIREQGIDLYRQDYNVDPLGYWRGADQPGREGITENHYVTGYLAFWDALLREFPNLVIDTCASGGHRNDLETLRRSVPLLRSDYILEPVGQQCHTYGLSPWMPFYGTGGSSMDAYTFRSQMCAHFIACFDMRRKDLPYDEGRRLLNQWKHEIAPNYFGDFYPLTPYTTANEAWMAWQFDRPESGLGVVQVFRRGNSIYESARLRLQGLNAKGRYVVTNLDKPESPQELTGTELADKGLLVTAPAQPTAAVYSYRLLK
jgi:alpha-galactosidase